MVLPHQLDWIIQRLDSINRKLDLIIQKEGILMGAADDILAAVTAETTVVNSVVAYIQGLQTSGVISPDAATNILNHIKANSDALSAAIVTNTPAAS